MFILRRVVKVTKTFKIGRKQMVQPEFSRALGLMTLKIQMARLETRMK